MRIFYCGCCNFRALTEPEMRAHIDTIDDDRERHDGEPWRVVDHPLFVTQDVWTMAVQMVGLYPWPKWITAVQVDRRQFEVAIAIRGPRRATIVTLSTFEMSLSTYVPGADIIVRRLGHAVQALIAAGEAL